MLLDQYYSNNNNTYPQNNISLNQKRAYGKKPKVFFSFIHKTKTNSFLLQGKDTFTRHLTVSFKSIPFKNKCTLIFNGTTNRKMALSNNKPGVLKGYSQKKSCLYKKAIIVKNNTFKSLKKTTIKKVNINKRPMITDKFRLRRIYHYYLTNNVIKYLNALYMMFFIRIKIY